MSYLNQLNPQQKEAVLTTEGPVLILAGAGAGKTKTITYRIAYLIEKGVAPENILAVTFTNKAALEMRERVEKLLRSEPSLKKPTELEGRPVIRTFHSLGVMILRENFTEANLPKNFSIWDRADSKKIIKDILLADGYDSKQYEPAKVLAIISRQKGDMISIEEYLDSGRGNQYVKEVIADTWRKYDKALSVNGALDFDDLILKATEMLTNNTAVREKYQSRFKYIHIDEYQDTNEVQYKMAKMLVGENKNICVVGDVDQNIYTWRGATIKNIMSFEEDYKGAKEIVLEENYRSTQNILKAANDVISKNTMRRPKNLFTKNHVGEKIFVYRAIDEYDEAKFAVKKARDLIKSGISPNEIAFLYRANFQSRVLEEICLDLQIPHQVVGTKFFDRKEIKDIISYIKSALNEKDFTNLNRIINTPPRGIGKATVLKIHAGEENTLTPAVREKIQNFRNFLAKIRKDIENKSPKEVISNILIESKMESYLKEDGDEGLERVQNIKELVSLAQKYDSLVRKNDDGTFDYRGAMEKLLEDVALATDQDELNEDKNGVKLMTVHAAKGLEFDYVFVTGMENGLFPMQRDNEKVEDSEEERRLFYVAITRAKKQVFLTWASFRTIFGSKEVSMSSEFLDDISEDILELLDFNGEVSGSGDEGEGSAGGNKKGGAMEYLIDF